MTSYEQMYSCLLLLIFWLYSLRAVLRLVFFVILHSGKEAKVFSEDCIPLLLAAQASNWSAPINY